MYNNDLTPVIEDILNDHKEAFGEFGITTAQQVIDESTKWSIHNIEKDRGFIRPGGEHAYQLLIWSWVTNTIGNFMIELQRRIENPVDTTGLGTIKTYDEFLTNWLSRQRVPEKVPQHWPGVLDV